MPRLFDCFQMCKLSYTKEEGQGLSKARGYLANGRTHREEGGKKCSARGSGSGHTSQEVTPAMPDYKQCVLSISAVLAVEHTTSVTAKGVALVGGRKDGFSPLSPSLFNAASIQ